MRSSVPNKQIQVRFTHRDTWLLQEIRRRDMRHVYRRRWGYCSRARPIPSPLLSRPPTRLSRRSLIRGGIRSLLWRAAPLTSIRRYRSLRARQAALVSRRRAEAKRLLGSGENGGGRPCMYRSCRASDSPYRRREHCCQGIEGSWRRDEIRRT
jgi:hypothetical protein